VLDGSAPRQLDGHIIFIGSRRWLEDLRHTPIDATCPVRVHARSSSSAIAHLLLRPDYATGLELVFILDWARSSSCWCRGWARADGIVALAAIAHRRARSWFAFSPAVC